MARHDGKFEIVQRHGFIAIADTLCGPYKMQKPTWTYPQANLPNVDSIYPKRTSIPGVSNPTYGWEEDPHIWYSGGIYHVIYSGSAGSRRLPPLFIRRPHELEGQRVRLVSAGLPEDLLLRGKHAPARQWYKMERPGVVLENGHPTHITWAVADVDKDNQIPAGSNHGSKVIVVPFDGVAFDADFGTGGTGGTGGDGRHAAARAASRGRAEARAAAARGVAAHGRAARAAADVAARTGGAGGSAGGGGRGGTTGGTGGSGAAAVPGPAVPPAAARPAARRRPAVRAARLQRVVAAAARPPAVVVEAAARLPAGLRAREASAAVRWLVVQRSWRHTGSGGSTSIPGEDGSSGCGCALGLGVARRRARARSAAGRVGHADSQATEPPNRNRR